MQQPSAVISNQQVPSIQMISEQQDDKEDDDIMMIYRDIDTDLKILAKP